MKLKFNAVFAHPKYNASYGDVIDVAEPDLVEQLVAGDYARPYVPAVLSEGAKPDAATNARIADLEAIVRDMAGKLAQAGVAVSSHIVPTAEPASGPFITA